MDLTPNQRIVQTAYALLRGDLKAEPTDPGLCLQLVRVVIETALYAGRWILYPVYRTIVVEQAKRASQDPYARDLEASLRDRGMALDLPRTGPAGDPSRYVELAAADAQGLLEPGDLLFRWDTAPDRAGVYIGHVGLLMPGQLVLENVRTRAGSLQRGPTTLAKLGTWPVTTVVRFTPAGEVST